MSYYPLFFQPVYKDYLWGGEYLRKYLNKIPPGRRCAESWEIAHHPDGMTLVANGSFQGKTLQELVDIMGGDLLGKGCQEKSFPLLVKLIDAQKPLSIQVHPNEEGAKRTGGEPKYEAWIALKGKDSSVYAGFNRNIHPEGFLLALKEKQLKTYLQHHLLKPGDAVAVPGGTVHAICSGSLLLEVQQCSNTTYRVYDWDRKDAQGELRPLHLDEAMQVMHWEKSQCLVQAQKQGMDTSQEYWSLLRTPYFCVDRFDLRTPFVSDLEKKSFQIFYVIEGEARIKTIAGDAHMMPGRCVLVPAACDEVIVEPIAQYASVLRISRYGEEER